MKRRAFITGMIAAGVLTLTPLEPVCGVFRPKYLTATDILRQNKEFMQAMESSFRDTLLYGNSITMVDSIGIHPISHGSKEWESIWANVDEHIRPSR